MEKYLFESFGASSADFDQEFTDFLNRKYKESLKVEQCSFCHDPDAKKMWASCLFKRKH